MKFRTRKRLALLVLVVGMPVYVIAAVTIVNSFERPPILVELAIYVGLGVVWILPFRRLFLGIARPDPDAVDGEGGNAAGGTATGQTAPGQTTTGQTATGQTATGKTATGGRPKAPR